MRTDRVPYIPNPNRNTKVFSRHCQPQTLFRSSRFSSSFPVYGTLTERISRKRQGQSVGPSLSYICHAALYLLRVFLLGAVRPSASAPSNRRSRLSSLRGLKLELTRGNFIESKAQQVGRGRERSRIRLPPLSSFLPPPRLVRLGGPKTQTRPLLLLLFPICQLQTRLVSRVHNTHAE